MNALLCGLNDRRGMVPASGESTLDQQKEAPMFAVSYGSRIAVIILSLGVVAGTAGLANAETWNRLIPAAPR